MPSGIFIGLMSGLASAVLFFSAARGGVLLQVLLFLLTPLPMVIVGVAFGWRAALAAALAGAAVMAAFGGARGIAFFLAFGAPAILSAWCADLGRRRADGSIGWLPAGDILASLATLGGLLPAVYAMALGGTFAMFKPEFARFVGQVFKQMEAQLTLPPTAPERIDSVAQTMIDMLPGVLAAYWVVLFAINLYLAGRVARKSGLLLRPWPNLHQLTPPPWLLLLLIGALLAWMAGGFVGIIGTGLIGAISMAFLFFGLSVLHAIAAGRVQWLLWLTYAGLFNPAGPYAMVAVAFLGFVEPLFRLRERFARPPPAAPAP